MGTWHVCLSVVPGGMAHVITRPGGVAHVVIKGPGVGIWHVSSSVYS